MVIEKRDDDFEIEVFRLPTIADFSTLKDFSSEELFKIFQFLDSPGRTALHCSAGLGRVSLFLISYLAAKSEIFSVENRDKLIYADDNLTVSVEAFMKLFEELRKKRPGLCQTKEQFRQIVYLSALFTLFRAGIDPQKAVEALNIDDVMRQADEAMNGASIARFIK